MDNQFEKWVQDCENELFQKEKFKSIGKQDDYIFQALAFVGNGSAQLSLATTVISELKEVSSELKEELKSIQQQLTDFQEKLRRISVYTED